jgi:hypothetical protein
MARLFCFLCSVAAIVLLQSSRVTGLFCAGLKSLPAVYPLGDITALSACHP